MFLDMKSLNLIRLFWSKNYLKENFDYFFWEFIGQRRVFVELYTFYEFFFLILFHTELFKLFFRVFSMIRS